MAALRMLKFLNIRLRAGRNDIARQVFVSDE